MGERGQEYWETALLLARENTAHKESFAKSYLTQKLDVAPRSSAPTGTDKKPCRFDTSRKTIGEKPILFEFDVTRNGHRRLQVDAGRFNDIVTRHGQQHFGGFAQQLPS
eukprot:4804337-Pyramimonas_sp.AAC.1